MKDLTKRKRGSNGRQWSNFEILSFIILIVTLLDLIAYFMR